MKRFKRPRYLKQLMFIGFLGLIIASGVIGGLYTRNQRQNAPKRSLDALKASLNEVVLASDALVAIDGTLDTSSYSIASTRSHLNNALVTSEKLLGDHKKTLSDQYVPLKNALGDERKAFDEFEAAYKILGKAIAYNPSLDLGQLDPNSQTEEINRRSQAAFDNLSKLANGNKGSFTEEAYDNLAETADCFGELADLSKSNQKNQLAAVSKRCIDNYPKTRNLLVTALIDTYNTDKLIRSQEQIKKSLD